MLNAQEVFDTVAAHPLTQNEKAFQHGFCRYRARKEDGTVLKCAAGCLIPDEHYQVEIEGLVVTSVEVMELIPAAGGDLYLLTTLQRTHDEYEVEQWRERLVEVAEQYGLNFAILDQFPPHQA